MQSKGGAVQVPPIPNTQTFDELISSNHILQGSCDAPKNLELEDHSSCPQSPTSTSSMLPLTKDITIPKQYVILAPDTCIKFVT